MMENNLEEAQALLKQYKMFSKALNFINDNEDKNDIKNEMDKLEQKILELTNISYEKQLDKILSEKTSFLKEERLKLQRLVDIINSRIDYVNLALKRHKLSTGNLLATQSIKGEELLSQYKNNIKIIDKYKENLRNKADLTNDIKDLDLKVSSALDRIESNKKTNALLEKKMMSLLEKTFNTYDCSELLERRKEIDLAYEELGISLDKARDNVKKAKLGNSADIIKECDNMLSSITLEYENYKEKKYILELIDIYDEEVSDYDSLFIKREKINDILKNISNSKIYDSINTELKNQFNTIRLEKQDVDTYNSLCNDRKKKQELIEEINKENSSEEFKNVLSEFLLNEKKYREELYLEQQKREYAERQKKMLKDKEIQEERNKRQKLIEEEKSKDIAKTTRQLLMEKKKTTEDIQMKKVETPITRVAKNSNILNKEQTIEKTRETSKEIPRKTIEDDTFFNNKEMQELSTSLSDKGSWF